MVAGSAEALLSEVIELLGAALDLLDRAQAPGNIGAHVDLARVQICELLRRPGADGLLTAPDLP